MQPAGPQGGGQEPRCTEGRGLRMQTRWEAACTLQLRREAGRPGVRRRVSGPRPASVQPALLPARGGRALPYTEGNNLLAPTRKVPQTTQTHQVQNQTQVAFPAFPASQPQGQPTHPFFPGGSAQDPALSHAEPAPGHQVPPALPARARPGGDHMWLRDISAPPAQPSTAGRRRRRSLGLLTFPVSTHGVTRGNRVYMGTRRAGSPGLHLAQSPGPGSHAQQSCGRP